jgi:nucleoside-diphosphate-sugar epimerase
LEGNKIKRIVITGGGGYIGAALSELLLDASHEVVVYDCFFFGKEPLKHLEGRPNFTVVKGDVQDTNRAASLIEQGTDIVHLASLSNDPSCDLDPKWSTAINHTATVNLAIEAKKRGCSKFAFASSCSVYGFGNNELLSETSICNPVSVYAQLKVKTEEELLAMESDTFLPTILRQATVFGLSPRMRFDLAINQMTMHAITKGNVFVMGGGMQWRPFLHVRDAATVFQSVIEADRSLVSGEVFNVGSNENNMQILKLAELVGEKTGVEVIVAPDDADRRNYNVDFSKIEKHLGINGWITIEKGIDEIADWVRRNDGKDFESGEFFNLKRVKEIASSGAKTVNGVPAPHG